eukprot:TRINITY_DN1231_c0_g2_i1.p1 TRINITY_DN1231_c0_g2~~TRINITY_DN1231_c0_g2_i1.p1  ORF type:complete len:496 (-),score=72.72 TRINITY_DN1231_c0_g2_i1:114-1601(-)
MQGMETLIYPVVAVAVIFLPVTILVGAGYGVFQGSILAGEGMKKAMESARKNSKECANKIRQHGIYKLLFELSNKIKSDPTNPKLLLERGRIWFFEGDHRNAVLDLSLALSGYESFSTYDKFLFHYALGVSYHKLGYFDKAQDQLDDCEHFYKNQYDELKGKNGDVTPNLQQILHSSAINLYNHALITYKDDGVNRKDCLQKGITKMNELIKSSQTKESIHTFHRALMRYYLSFCPEYFEVKPNTGDDQRMLPGVQMSDEGLKILMFAAVDFCTVCNGNYYHYYSNVGPNNLFKLSMCMRNQCIPFYHAFMARKLYEKYSIKHVTIKSNGYAGLPNEVPYHESYTESLRANKEGILSSCGEDLQSVAYFCPLPGEIISWDIQRLLWIAKLKPNKDCTLSILPSELILKIVSFGEYNLHDFIIGLTRPWPSKIQEFKDKHDFEMKMLGQPHWCQHCGSHIKSWGLKKHCVCKCCSMIVHDKCKDQVITSCYVDNDH